MPYLNHTEWGGIKQSQAQVPTPWGKPSQRSKVVQCCFRNVEPGGGMQAADTNALSRETPTGIGGLQAEDTRALSLATSIGVGGGSRVA